MILVMKETNGIEVIEVYHVKVKGSTLVYNSKEYYPVPPVIVNLLEKSEVYLETPEKSIWIKKDV